MRLIRIIEDGVIKVHDIAKYYDVEMDSIELKDNSGTEIFVGDILYNSYTDTYHTVFKVPGGYAIESNPKSFGIYDHFHNNKTEMTLVYESTGDPQTSSYISQSCKVIGNIYEGTLYNDIKSLYPIK